MTSTQTNRVFWKCQTKGCKHVRVTDNAVRGGRTFVPGVETTYDFHIGDWAFATAEIRTAWTAAGLVCPEHNQLMRGDVLNGTYNPDKICDGRCMSARRASCDCSCGGTNHGQSHI